MSDKANNPCASNNSISSKTFLISLNKFSLLEVLEFFYVAFSFTEPLLIINLRLI